MLLPCTETKHCRTILCQSRSESPIKIESKKTNFKDQRPRTKNLSFHVSAAHPNLAQVDAVSQRPAFAKSDDQSSRFNTGYSGHVNPGFADGSRLRCGSLCHYRRSNF